MKQWILVTALIVFVLGCDSENKKTYEFSGYWTFSDLKGLCTFPLPPQYGGGTLEFETIVVKVYKTEEDQEAGDVYREVSVPCDSGEFTVDDLDRGTYFVNVAAMAPDPEEDLEVPDAGVDVQEDTEKKTRAYFESTEKVVVPTDDDEKVAFEMKFGSGSIEVSWGFANSLQCAAAQNQVATVEIDIVGQAIGNDFSSDALQCTAGSWKVTDLQWDIYTVSVLGFDEDGKQTHLGKLDTALEIRPGTNLVNEDGVIVLLEPLDP